MSTTQKKPTRLEGKHQRRNCHIPADTLVRVMANPEIGDTVYRHGRRPPI
ncbi:Hypothetical protein FKW44_017416 [Caligus rogercresseyi]|uniref:Uncharacterized protein n=1 Tax=Caligus rogercresseyi TaxID=217165 RepID=A0A7T8GSZ8_CALRO|nr:Hypothetical protein FKW44_017416 [Caligus rogercresseyi]